MADISLGTIHQLTDDAITALSVNRQRDLKPILQILQSKVLASGKIRAVLSDGSTLYQHCILYTKQIELMQERKQLEHFTVFRVEKYDLKELKTAEETLTVVAITEVTVLALGAEIGTKLTQGDTFTITTNLKSSDAILPPEEDELEEVPATNETAESEAVDVIPETPSPSPAIPVTPPPAVNLDPVPAKTEFTAAQPSTPIAGPSTSKSPVITPSTTRKRLSDYPADKIPLPELPTWPRSKRPKIRLDELGPISAINPFFTGWTVRGRVTAKTEPKPWYKGSRKGKVFSFNVVDASGEIQMTAFNNEADKFYEVLEVGKVYYICRGNVRPANPRFSTVDHPYEVTLKADTLIERYTEEETEVTALPTLAFNFRSLDVILSEPLDTLLDVLGIIRSIGELEQFTSRRTGKEVIKREITIVDPSRVEVLVVLWGERATEFNGQVEQPIAIRAVSIADFNGKNLSTSHHSLVYVQPDIPQVPALVEWYQKTGKTATYTKMSTRKPPTSANFAGNQSIICTISRKRITAMTADAPDQLIYFNITGTVESMSRITDHFYKACGENGCLKKVLDDNSGLYRCTKCNKEKPYFTWRLLFRLAVADATDTLWMTVFQEQAVTLLGKPIEELIHIYEKDQEVYHRLVNLKLKNKQFTFRVGVRLEDYQEEHRLKVTVYGAKTIEVVERSKQLMAMIDALGGAPPAPSAGVAAVPGDT